MLCVALCQATASPQTSQSRALFPDLTANSLFCGRNKQLWWPPARRVHMMATMDLFRFAALAPLLVAASCYRDAAPQSTLPEPQYVAGPPGGTAPRDPRDPGSPTYSQLAGEPGWQPPPPPISGATPSPQVAATPDDDDDDDADAGPGAGDPANAGPQGAEDDVADSPAGTATPLPAGPGAIALGGAPDGLVDPASRVSDAEIDAALEGQGQWIDTDDYGQVWRPDATQVGVDFTPYESGGSWEYTDAGWAFASDYPWGWLPFHYGRWAWFHDYWGWVPGHRWGAAYVDWRHGGGVVGWRPSAPRIRDHRGGIVRDHRHGDGPMLSDHRPAQLHDAHWRFAATADFARPHVRSHLYGNLAEGLRVTSPVAAPPLRARSTVRVNDLMRSRFAATGRPQRFQRGPGRAAPTGGYDRGYGRAAGSGYDRARSYQPYQAPARGYAPPRSYGSSSSPTGSWSSGRGYRGPPPRSFRPSSPAGSPSRAWSRPTQGYGGRPAGSLFGGSHGSSGSHGGGGSSHGSGGSRSSGGHGGRH